jgi:hypothetical protein
MAKDIGSETDSSVRLAFQAIGSILFWIVAFAVANRILAGDPQDVRVRVAAVLLAAVGFGCWVWVVAKIILVQDEFRWRIHVIALAWAFAATGLFVMFADLLVRARFIGYLQLMHIWMFMILAWWVSMVLTSRHFR